MYKKVIVIAVVSILSLFLFTGCIPKGYTREEEKEFLREAKKAAEAYLESAYSGAVIEEIGAETTVENSEYVLTEFARGVFHWQEQPYIFVVNAKTGEVYTSVCLDEIKEGIKETLIQDLEIDAYEVDAVYYEIYYRGWRDNNAETGTFFCVFPEGETAKNLLQKVLTDTEEYVFSMEIQYKGGDIPQKIMEGEAPFPTLEKMTLYHVAQEHELYEERWNSRGNLQALSREILQCNYGEDSVEYTRKQAVECDGLQVVYDAYEWKREQERVTEETTDEEDISVAISEEKIVLDCTKEQFCLYLLTTDRKIAEEYLYVFHDHVFNKETLEKGIWYPYGNIYIYSDIYSDNIRLNAHKFSHYYKTGNVIYKENNI